MLVALALFLLTYRGYRNKYGRFDRLAARIAGGAAILVAFLPTAAPGELDEAAWWSAVIGKIHYASAIVLFLMFAVFSLWLFRLGDPPPDKPHRDSIYIVCGIVILASMVWAGIAGYLDQPIFYPESVALVAFAISWLVKGRAHKSIANAVQKLSPDT